MNDLSPNLAARAGLVATLDAQRAAFARGGAPSLSARRDALDRCIGLLVDHKDAICDALAEDFGWRSKDTTALTDVAGSIGPLKHARDHLAAWMKPEKRKTTPPILSWFGAKAEVRFQPKGVVGCISPWNFPVNLTFAPLAGILAAGNRCMIKPSEFTPATGALMKAMFAKAFSEEEIAVCLGGPEVGSAFAALPFDHLVFTGGTSIGRRVMMAAAENLVPVTLELGGKSPVLIGRSASMPVAAARIMAGKTLNAGQICLAPDYVLVAEDQRDAFVAEATASVARMFPTIRDNADYGAIISQRHYDRIRGYVDEAREMGAQVVELNPASEDFSQQEHRKIPPTLILGATDQMKVMREEIFGPILPVVTYGRMDEAVARVNAGERPLGLYYFGNDPAEQEQVLSRTTSGGVTVNDVVFHVAMEDLPFGGIGPAGMGRYHGRDGFLEFSHQKAVYSQLKKDVAQMAQMRPPYDTPFRDYVESQIKR